MTEQTPEPADSTEEKSSTQAQATSPRPGVPVWRVGKPDAFLADAVAVAREAVLSIASEHAIGAHVAARSEGVRVVTHLFECNLAGYVGWQWFATVTRISRSKDVTVDEVGLLPTEDSVLAPPWVPWAERVRPEDAHAHAEAIAADVAAAEAHEAAIAAQDAEHSEDEHPEDEHSDDEHDDGAHQD